MAHEELAMASRDPHVDAAAAGSGSDSDYDGGGGESDGPENRVELLQDATDASTSSSSGSLASTPTRADTARTIKSPTSLRDHHLDASSSASLLVADAGVQRRASAGHAVAQRFVAAHELVEQARGAFFEERAERRALEKVRRAVTLWWRLPVDRGFLNELLRAAGGRVALPHSGSADACFAFALGDASAAQQLEAQHGGAEVFWRQCVAAFPAVAVFQYWLALRLAEDRRFGDALVFADTALALEWNPQWLYLRARCLSSQPAAGLSERVDAFRRYIAQNPPDEEHVPEAYYALALLYLEQGEYALAKRYQALAQLAERPPVRFPCFGLVDDEFRPKRMLRVAFGRPLLLLSIKEQLACVETAELECECCQEWVPLLSLLRHKMWDCRKRHVGCLLCGVSMDPDMFLPHQELMHSPS